MDEKNPPKQPPAEQSPPSGQSPSGQRLDGANPQQNPVAPMNTNTPPPPPQTPENENQQKSPPPKKSLPKWILAALVLIIVAFLATGAYAGYTLLSPQPTPTPTPTQAPQQPTPTPDPTADWQTYAPEGENYVFKYPSDWEYIPVSEGCGPVFMSPDKKYWLSECGPNLNNETPEQLAEGGKGAGHTTISEESITIDGHAGIRQENSYISSSPGGVIHEVNIFIGNVSIQTTIDNQSEKRNGTLALYFSVTSQLGLQEALNQLDLILSTFHFKEEATILPITPPEGVTQCTLEAKICPDGSTVGRQGPNCEFEECPSLTNQ